MVAFMSEHQAKAKLQAEHEQTIQQEIDAFQKTANDYLAVYGEEGKRTPQQESVWRDFMNNSFIDRPTFGLSPAGTVDPLVLAHNEGKRASFLLPQRMVKMALDRKELETFVRNRFKKS